MRNAIRAYKHVPSVKHAGQNGIVKLKLASAETCSLMMTVK
jgi:hypothetical protein